MKKTPLYIVAIIAFVSLTAFTIKGNINNRKFQECSICVSDEDEIIMEGEVCHAMFKDIDDPAPSRITIDVYKTPRGRYYANMTSPEKKTNMSIFKLTGSVYNAYIS